MPLRSSTQLPLPGSNPTALNLQRQSLGLSSAGHFLGHPTAPLSPPRRQLHPNVTRTAGQRGALLSDRERPAAGDRSIRQSAGHAATAACDEAKRAADPSAGPLATGRPPLNALNSARLHPQVLPPPKPLAPARRLAVSRHCLAAQRQRPVTRVQSDKAHRSNENK
jgi:hypothetical protein